MKKITYLFSLILFALLLQSVQAQNWNQLSSPVSTELKAIKFIDANTGIAVGVLGKIIKTTNAGATWVEKNSTQSSGINDLVYLNAQTVIACGSFGRIYRSTDGGESWIVITTSTSNNLFALSFTSSTEGYASGANRTLLQTTDGGLTWIAKGSGGVGGYTTCHFFDSMNGIVPLVDLQILKTSDGGNSWIDLYFPPDIAADMCFPSSSEGYIVGSGGFILKTSNSGDNWQQVQGTGQDYNLLGISCVGDTKGYAVGRKTSGEGIIIKSTNRGDSWTVGSIVANGLYNITVSADGYLYAVGENGAIYKTDSPVGINTISSEIPEGYELSQNYPNPFNPTTNIEFSLPKKSNVTLSIFDITGREIARLVNNEALSTGSYNYNFTAKNLTSGVYFYRLQTETFVETKKMTLVK